MNKLKILFLLRTNYNYSSYSTPKVKAGLINSVIFLSEALMEEADVDTKVSVVVDGNSVDKEVHDYRPNICIMDAIWVTPKKMMEVQKLHPTVQFIMRVHSKIPFLANEGLSLTWIKEYMKIPNVMISNNNKFSNDDYIAADIPSSYLPNVYRKVSLDDDENIHSTRKLDRNQRLDKAKEITIGCFGAIRPLKNQLLQAFAAIHFANKHDAKLNFHINGERIEQKGEEVLANIRALFSDSKHQLVEHSWENHEDFLEIVSKMDIGMQCSYSESFNIVAADFVSQRVAIVVSDEVYWMQDLMKVNPNVSKQMVRKLETAYKHKHKIAYRSAQALNRQRTEALRVWNEFLNLYR